MKKLISLISTTGRKQKQITREVWQAYLKSQNNHKKSLELLKKAKKL